MDFIAGTNNVGNALEVGVMDNPYDITTFTSIKTIKAKTIASKYPYPVYFDKYNGNGKYIAFVCRNMTSNFYVDDILISEVGDCLPPYDISATQINANSAMLNWSQDTNQQSYQIKISTMKFLILSLKIFPNISISLFESPNLVASVFQSFTTSTTSEIICIATLRVNI